MKLSDILLLIKGGKRAAVGEIRNWKGGSYIKTPTGWKPHEKQYSKKYTERKNNAATKKDTDLRNRQSEVARLSGEIQGHKAAVEHHTSQNTKQDTRQAKHHSIRAQVKQRRLDKHKEILEQRHGVSINTSHPLSLDGFTDSYVNSSRYADKIKSNPEMLELEKDAAKQKWVDTLKEKSLTERLPNQAIDDYVSEFGVNALHSVFRGVHEKGIEGWLPKDMRESRDNSYENKMEEVNKLQNKAKIQEEKQTRKNIKESKRHGVKDEVVKPVKKKQFNFSKPLSLNSIQNNTWGKQPENLSNDDLLKTYAYVQYANYAIKRNLINAPTGKTHILPQVGGQDNINAFENEIKKRGLENAFEIDIDLSQTPEYVKQQAKANFEKWKADRQEEKPKETAKATSEYDKLKKEFQEWQEKRKKPSEMTDYEAQRRLEQGRKFREKFDKLEKPTPQEQPKPKKDLIQSGSRGATIAGQQYSKREVDILNSLDEIIGRAKSPVVQDLLKKRQAAKIELPSKELGQPKLAAHESKFMELVKRNRSQADKQAGYPEERRKVEADTGVKIPREKVNDILSGKSSQVSSSKPDDKGREERKMNTPKLYIVEQHFVNQSKQRQDSKLSTTDYITKTIKEREDARQSFPYKGYKIKLGKKINFNFNAENLDLPKEHEKYVSALNSKINGIKDVPVKGNDANMKKKIILSSLLYKLELAENQNVIDFSVINQAD